MSKQTAGKTLLGEFAPQFARLNDEILFGQIWSDNKSLCAHDRSLITITALISTGCTEQLDYHLRLGKQNGITQTTIAAVITHLAFYVGWPKAWSAFQRAQTIWTQSNQSPVGCPPDNDCLFALGEKNTAYANYFSGNSYINMLVKPQTDQPLSIAHVTFEPSCRNHWHIHLQDAQILLITAGQGWYQQDGQPAQALYPGDVITIPAGVKHWHGASQDSWFSHLAISQSSATEWLEAVDDHTYQQLSSISDHS
ncbi:carboxymuconolactone decarboxylase family protein [Neisseriaceae bacterium ESL0693]|nr:carboxymuconolactone decarboxylase family protein [Neisseriaceae bacterium ESL0693]